MKTWVMMIGEMDFTDIFHGDQDDGAGVEDQVFYEETTYAIFVAFLILMAIILMNLLVSITLFISGINPYNAEIFCIGTIETNSIS